MLEKKQKRYRRHKRIRVKVFGTKQKPRFCVFRSAKHTYAQLIDDEKGKTILNSSDFELKAPKTKSLSHTKSSVGRQKAKEEKTRSGKVALAHEVGKLIAKKALDKKIEKVVFDRGGYKYHGRVKAVAEGAREGGLKF